MIITIIRQEYLEPVQAYLESSTKEEREKPLCVSHQCYTARLIQLFRWLTNDGTRKAQITRCGVYEKLLEENCKEAIAEPQLYVSSIEFDHCISPGQLRLCGGAMITAQVLRTQQKFPKVGCTIAQCTNEVCRFIREHFTQLPEDGFKVIVYWSSKLQERLLLAIQHGLAYGSLVLLVDCMGRYPDSREYLPVDIVP